MSAAEKVSQWIYAHTGVNSVWQSRLMLLAQCIAFAHISSLWAYIVVLIGFACRQCYAEQVRGTGMNPLKVYPLEFLIRLLFVFHVVAFGLLILTSPAAIYPFVWVVLATAWSYLLAVDHQEPRRGRMIPVHAV
jgi:hypothetical protein